MRINCNAPGSSLEGDVIIENNNFHMTAEERPKISDFIIYTAAQNFTLRNNTIEFYHRLGDGFKRPLHIMLSMGMCNPIDGF